MTNIDPQEIDKFAQLAQEWWNVEGKLKTLHDINPARLGYIKAHITLQGKTLLDVGCGGGILSESLEKAGATVMAIDMDQQAINAAKAHQQTSNSQVDYQYYDVAQLAKEKPNTFDIITCMEMLEHVPDPAAIIQACTQLLKPGGTLFLSTINRTAKAYALAILGAEYVLGLLPKGTHDYKKFIKPAELVGICRDLQLNCEDLSGMSYNPINRNAAINKDTGVNYLACFSKATD